MSVGVTAVIATYNRSHVLRHAVASVLDQTFRDFELLVVGDACTDDSADVVASFRDARVRWINLPENTKHQSGPNNEALRLARGEVVAYLGHDDLWLPHHLEAMVGALDRANADLAYSLGVNIGPDGSMRTVIPRPDRGSFSSPLCMAHRRRVTEAMGGWKHYRDLTMAPDVELWRRAQSRGHAFTFVPRLTGLKFPGSWRRDVYRSDSADEQRAWLARIQSEPDLEATLLVGLVAGDGAVSGLAYRDLVAHFLSQTSRRARARLGSPVGRRSRPGEEIDAIRKYKGLDG